jgi:hypothetical protein
LGSYLLPGWKNLAITPATNPIMMVQRMLIARSQSSSAECAAESGDFQYDYGCDRGLRFDWRNRWRTLVVPRQNRMPW